MTYGLCTYPGCRNQLTGYLYCLDHCQTTPCQHGEADWRDCEACVEDERGVRLWERSRDK